MLFIWIHRLLPMLPIDARLGQILSLSGFLLLGVSTRDWTLQPAQVGAIILTSLTTQIAWCWLIWRTDNGATSPNAAPLSQAIYHRLPSALITALGLSLLLRADHISTLIGASSAAISSKFLLQVNNKHIFNPGNFGIVLALLCTHDAWVSPGQWGNEGWYALLFLGAGGLVLKAVGRWDTSLIFLVSYASLEAIRNCWLGWTWDVWLHRLMSGSLLLFALFMITDPRTIPNARIGRIIWALLIAILTFVLRNVFFVSTAMFWALFVLAPLSLLFDRWLPEARFEWQQTEQEKTRENFKVFDDVPQALRSP